MQRSYYGTCNVGHSLIITFKGDRASDFPPILYEKCCVMVPGPLTGDPYPCDLAITMKRRYAVADYEVILSTHPEHPSTKKR